MRKINPEAAHEAPQKTNYIEVIAKAFEDSGKERFEDCEDLLRRADVIRSFMKEYLRIN